jgi:type IV secretory pathway VirB6-like protein
LPKNPALISFLATLTATFAGAPPGFAVYELFIPATGVKSISISPILNILIIYTFPNFSKFLNFTDDRECTALPSIATP